MAFHRRNPATSKMAWETGFMLGLPSGRRIAFDMPSRIKSSKSSERKNETQILFGACESVRTAASASLDWAVAKTHAILGTIKLLSQQRSSPGNLVRPFLNETNIVWSEGSALLFCSV